METDPPVRPEHVAGIMYLTEITRAGQTELMLATDSDIDAIAAAMAHFADAIKNKLASVADD